MAQQGQEPIRGVTPVGRIIWGSVFEKQTEGYQGAKYDEGSEPFQFGLAIRKDDPGVNDLLFAIKRQALAGYPNNANMAGRIEQEWNSGFTMNMFKFKVRDGDKPNDKGVVHPNGKGCWVFNMSTTLPLKCANAQNAEIDPKQVKRGFYVDIAYSCKVNGLTDANAGVYLNPQIVRLIAFGEEIVGGPSIDEAFKNHAAPTHLPPGASATPVGGGAMPGMDGWPGNGPGGAGNAGATMPGVTASPSNGPGAGAMPGNAGQVQTSSPGGPGNSTTSSPSDQRPKFDPNTGQPIVYPDQVQQAAPRFDPNTGQPLNPQTGQPVMPHETFARGPGQG